MAKTWYRITVLAAHRGAGRYEELDPIYVHVKDVSDANRKLQYVRGFKRRYSREILPVKSTQVQSLEQEIRNSEISLKKAKSHWYRTKTYYEVES